MSVYAASKSFVIFFSRGLRYELRNSPVSVTVISPGPTSTGFMNRAGMKEDWLVERSRKVSMTSDEVAAIAVEGMLKGKAEIVPGFLNVLAAKLTSFAPKILAEKIAARLYEK
jgi:short-subunit dehydrogenase